MYSKWQYQCLWFSLSSRLFHMSRKNYFFRSFSSSYFYLLFFQEKDSSNFVQAEIAQVRSVMWIHFVVFSTLMARRGFGEFSFSLFLTFLFCIHNEVVYFIVIILPTIKRSFFFSFHFRSLLRLVSSYLNMKTQFIEGGEEDNYCLNTTLREYSHIQSGDGWMCKCMYFHLCFVYVKRNHCSIQCSLFALRSCFYSYELFYNFSEMKNDTFDLNFTYSVHCTQTYRGTHGVPNIWFSNLQ